LGIGGLHLEYDSGRKNTVANVVRSTAGVSAAAGPYPRPLTGSNAVARTVSNSAPNPRSAGQNTWNTQRITVEWKIYFGQLRQLRDNHGRLFSQLRIRI